LNLIEVLSSLGLGLLKHHGSLLFEFRSALSFVSFKQVSQLYLCFGL